MVIGLSPVADRTSTAKPKFFGTADSATRKASAPKAKAKTTKKPSAVIPTSGTVGGSYTAPTTKAATKDYSKDALGDSSYLADAASLKRALERYQTDDTLARGRQGIDYGQALRNLGWNQGTNAWDVEDKGQGYGQATNAARQNFASRGMLQGSGYATASQNLNRDFTNQLTDINTANQQYLTDADTALARYQVDNEEARLASLNAAIDRLKAKATSGLF